MVPAEGGPGTPGGWGKPGVSCGLEILAHDLGDGAGFGPDIDRWHGCQELVKWLGIQDFLDLLQHLGTGGQSSQGTKFAANIAKSAHAWFAAKNQYGNLPNPVLFNVLIRFSLRPRAG